jgi:hypothetical protein
MSENPTWIAGAQLPHDPFSALGERITGFGTPCFDLSVQMVLKAPDRVIPVIFLPGIMGSNLKITSTERMRLLGRDPKRPQSNVAWRPDSIGAGNAYEVTHLTPGERQLLLEPNTTAVDVYNPDSKNAQLDGDTRHENVKLPDGFDSPLLRSDPKGVPNGRTAAQKARMRGWGEVYFESYGELLQRVESRLQRVSVKGKPAPGWEQVVGVDPARWMLDRSTPQKPLTLDELKAITKGTFFPVHAIGYNWLISNRLSAQAAAQRIRNIVDTYTNGPARKYKCPGVIVVTHSMGGLLGRALIHPDMGGLQDLVLGVVHGVQPAIGAAAAYKRIHAGFEDPGLVSNLDGSVGAKVAGNFGDEVTAVLASSPGGLQLLPSRAYGNGWLKVRLNGHDLATLPAKGDPYEEIYKLRGKWYGLFPTEAWVNPSQRTEAEGGNTIEKTMQNVDVAKQFHDALESTYHEHTYAHYGADPGNRAFGDVVWEISGNCRNSKGWQDWPILRNSRQGQLTLAEFTQQWQGPLHPAFGDAPRTGAYNTKPITATIQPPEEPGDQTVPMRSADHQMRSGKCKAVFRQTGYDHQGSYKNENVLAATLFSILRIAQRVQLP